MRRSSELIDQFLSLRHTMEAVFRYAEFERDLQRTAE